MLRAVRHEYEGATYHVMCRGNNGQSIFELFRPLDYSEEPAVAVKKGSGERLFLSTLAIRVSPGMK
ncbi:MAG: hypothetical protein PF495_18355 [Spirochaetales bacterium]|jgi:hypothetical protein|nr:hypothetical protein [Spirochaetales bacterium]